MEVKGPFPVKMLRKHRAGFVFGAFACSVEICLDAPRPRAHTSLFLLVAMTSRSRYEKLQKQAHFVQMPDWQFRSVEIDKVSAREMVKYMVVTKKSRDIGRILLGAAGTDKGERQNALLLKELLERCFTLDPDKRLVPLDCLKHPFISETARQKKEVKGPH